MKILFLNVWPEIWAASRRHLDHSVHEIWHVCEQNGIKYIQGFLGDGEIKGLTMVDSEDVGILLEKLKAVYAEFPFERVVSLDEITAMPAALIRDVFDVPGPRLADVELYRDKRKMKECVGKGGIRVIRDLDPASFDTESFTPCVVKKVDGAAAVGVHICRDRAEFERHRGGLAEGALLEEYVAGEIFHIDGAFNSSGLVAMPHAYVNNCYNHYVLRQPLGSVGVDDPALKQRLVEFARRVVAAMPLREGIFHLEVIRNERDELVFLEIGCRVGGGEIYTNFFDVYDFDLLGFSIACQLGENPELTALRDQDVAGYLLINDFPVFPGVFTALHCGPLADDNCMYSVKNPKIGRRVGDRTYDFVAFALRARSAAEVRRSIEDLVANVKLQSAAVAAH